MTRKFYEKLNTCLDEGFECYSATVIQGTEEIVTGHHWLKVGNDVVFGAVDGLNCDFEQACSELSPRRPGFVREVETPSGSLNVHFELHQPQVRLIIAGGGHIGQALAKVGDFLGYSILVYDERKSFIEPGLFPEGTALVWGKYDEISIKVDLRPSDCAVIVTHAHAGDYDALISLLKRPMRYLGMIGSKTKVAKLKKRAVESGIEEASLDRVFTPVGLAIGAETVEEIAVSIIGEIVAWQRGADLSKAGSCSITGLK